MGKNGELEEIYRLYMHDLYHYLYSLCRNKYLAEDLVQETFYRAYIYLESYQGEKIKPWLFKVAYHSFIDVMRKEKRLTYYDSNAIEYEIDSKMKSAEHVFIEKNSIEQWFKALEALHITKRHAVLLRDYYHFSYQEIAEVMEMSLAKVKISIYRGRKEVQKVLSKGEGGEGHELS